MYVQLTGHGGNDLSLFFEFLFRILNFTLEVWKVLTFGRLDSGPFDMFSFGGYMRLSAVVYTTDRC